MGLRRGRGVARAGSVEPLGEAELPERRVEGGVEPGHTPALRLPGLPRCLPAVAVRPSAYPAAGRCEPGAVRAHPGRLGFQGKGRADSRAAAAPVAHLQQLHPPRCQAEPGREGAAGGDQPAARGALHRVRPALGRDRLGELSCSLQPRLRHPAGRPRTGAAPRGPKTAMPASDLSSTP